jgi:hypothetical protein
MYEEKGIKNGKVKKGIIYEIINQRINETKAPQYSQTKKHTNLEWGK